MFPSSQVSGLKTMKSPQIGEHTEGYPEQLYPVSMVQFAEHPSFVAVPPSSHSSDPFMRESPQMGEQVPPYPLLFGQ